MRIALLTLAGALALSGCGRSEPEEQPIDNEAIETSAPEAAAPIENLAMPPANVANAAEPAPAAPPPEFSDQEQMLDDADATGLTARLPQGEGEAPGSTENQARPAE